jgi:hypothetical protein
MERWRLCTGQEESSTVTYAINLHIMNEMNMLHNTVQSLCFLYSNTIASDVSLRCDARRAMANGRSMRAYGSAPEVM